MKESMEIQKNVLLSPYTTLGVGGSAEYFVEVASEEELKEVAVWAHSRGLRVTILAGGSNVLIADEGVQGLVIRPNFSTVQYEEEKESERVHVTAGAGVVFDSLVADTVHRGLWGLENLSSIPGSVGATPVQNVGAYGVEVQSLIKNVRVYNLEEEKFLELSPEECLFSYRNSLFKNQEGKKYVIVNVTFVLQKKAQPITSYKDMALYFQGNKNPKILEVRNAVMEIRSQKFPDWNIVGTAGSFFKNPLIEKAQYDVLCAEYPELPGFLQEDGRMKISLGWVLEHICKLKGYEENGVSLFKNQALVLVCKKGISAKKIEMFSQKIIDEVFKKTKIEIEREVTLIK